jgi:hypothetical protein
VYYLDFRCGSGTLWCGHDLCSAFWCGGSYDLGICGGVVCYVTAFKIGKVWVVQNGKFDILFIEAQLRAAN